MLHRYKLNRASLLREPTEFNSENWENINSSQLRVRATLDSHKESNSQVKGQPDPYKPSNQNTKNAHVYECQSP